MHKCSLLQWTRLYYLVHKYICFSIIYILLLHHIVLFCIPLVNCVEFSKLSWVWYSIYWATIICKRAHNSLRWIKNIICYLISEFIMIFIKYQNNSLYPFEFPNKICVCFFYFFCKRSEEFVFSSTKFTDRF